MLLALNATSEQPAAPSQDQSGNRHGAADPKPIDVESQQPARQQQ